MFSLAAGSRNPESWSQARQFFFDSALASAYCFIVVFVSLRQPLLWFLETAQWFEGARWERSAYLNIASLTIYCPSILLSLRRLRPPTLFSVALAVFFTWTVATSVLNRVPDAQAHDLVIVIATLLAYIGLGELVGIDRLLSAVFAATQAGIALSAVVVLTGGGVSYPHGTWAGAFGHKNHLGFVCGLSALAGAHLVVRNFRSRRWFRLITVSFTSGLSLWVLFFKTGNASGPAGLLVASVGGAVAIASRGYARKRNPSLGNDLVSGVLLPAYVLAVLAGVVTGRELLAGLVGRSPTFTGRTTQWAEGLEGTIKRPVTGWGWWAAHDNPDFTGLFERYSGFTTHSFWVQTALGSGIPGFVLTMLTITLGLIALSKAFSRRRLAVLPAVAIPLYALVFLSAEDVRSQYAMSLAVLVLFMFDAARDSSQCVTAGSTGHRSGRQFGR